MNHNNVQLNEQRLKWGLIALVALVLGGFTLVFDKFEPQWGALTLVLIAGAAALPIGVRRMNIVLSGWSK